MDKDKQLRISNSLDPKGFIGKCITFECRQYELVSILATGMQKIVYELRDLETNEPSHVLKVFREKLSKKTISEFQSLQDKLKSIQHELKIIRNVEAKYFFIGDWPVAIEKRLPSGGIPLSELMIAGQVQEKEGVWQAAQLYSSQEFELGLAECELKLQEFPLNPDYLAIQGLCLIALQRIPEANKIIQLCLEVDPDKVRHYKHFSVAAIRAGQVKMGRTLAYDGTQFAENDPNYWEFVFNLEAAFGCIYFAEICLKKLISFGLPSSQIEEMKGRLKEYSSEVVRADSLLEEAWTLVRSSVKMPSGRQLVRAASFSYVESPTGQIAKLFRLIFPFTHSRKINRWDKATQIIEQVTSQFPTHAKAYFLLGLIELFGKKQTTKAIHVLEKALYWVWLDDKDTVIQEINFYLGLAYLMINDLEKSSYYHNRWAETYIATLCRVEQGFSNPQEPEHPTEVVIDPRTDMRPFTSKEYVEERCNLLCDWYGSLQEIGKNTSIIDNSLEKIETLVHYLDNSKQWTLTEV